MILKKQISKMGLLLGITSNFLTIASHGQTQNPYIPKVIPPSPNAASLIKFADIPVSTYTGAADVSVPVYTISGKDISVPVSLSYHTGGIKQKEEASWVGLGWALNAGGCISRSIMDQDDLNGNYFDKPVPEITANLTTHPAVSGLDLSFYAYDMFCDHTVSTDQGIKDFSQALQTPVPLYDMEPDLYNYNFSGHSGKFMITRAKNIVLQKQDNIRIELLNDNNNTPLNYYFKITDENGNVYLFRDKEYTYSSSDISQKISSWYLTQINSQKNETINFNYLSDNSWSSLPGDKSQTYRWGCSQNGYELTTTESAYNLYWNITLYSIDFDNGQVKFEFDNSRSDISNGKRLNNIKIYSKDASSTLKYLWEYQLTYSYFNQGYTGSPTEYLRLRLDKVQQVSGSAALSPYTFYYIDPMNTSLTAKHSYSVDHWGYSNGSSLNSIYLIPPYHGVYSPQGSNSPPVYLSLEGANRDPNISYIKTFALEQVQYPTGGKTIFEYEANEYDEGKSFTGPVDFEETELKYANIYKQIPTRGTSTGTIDFSNIFPVLAASTTGTNVTVKVTFRSGTNNCCSDNINKTIYANFNGVTTSVANTDLVCNNGYVLTKTYADKITSNGLLTYTIVIDNTATSNFQDVRLDISWNELQRNDPESPIIAGGGLRIKTITDYSSDGTIAKKRNWNYRYEEDKDGNGIPETYSYGRRMSPPCYSRYEPMISGTYYGAPANQGHYYCESLTRFSSSNTSLTSSVQGNAVGYDQVTEYTVDPVTSLDIGKTVYKYFNSPDTVLYYNGFRLPGTLNMGNSLSGCLIEKSDYKNINGNYTMVSDAVNTYSAKNRVAYYSAKYNFLQNSNNPLPGICNGNIGSGTEYLLCFYPSIKSEKVLLNNTVETIYDQADNTKKLITTKNYYYDNPLHYMLTRTTATDSKGNTNISVLKYPQDYIPTNSSVTNNSILDAMLSKNMVTPIIEKKDNLTYAGSSINYTKAAVLSQYKILGSGAIDMDKIYKADLPAPATGFQGYSVNGNTTSKDGSYRQVINFDNYDNQNNISQFTATDMQANSFIWDYKQNYPVAQVKNGAVGDIAFTSFEADGSGNWTIPSTSRTTNYITGKQSYNLGNGSVSKTVTSSNTYIVSYWSMNGAATVSGSPGPVKQGNSVTINGDVWTYYEHKVTGVSTVTIAPSGSGLLRIDELRLYPSNAQMTSFTYEPLIGMTSQSDINNRISYYEYDVFGRLTIMRDQDRNILKKIDYAYYTGGGITAGACVAGGNCTGNDKKCINGFCETGRRINDVTKLLTTGFWKCTYHYLWSNGDISSTYSETTNTAPCPLD